MSVDASQSQSDAVASAEPRQVRVAGHDVWLHVESHSLIAAMVADIRQAQKRVWLEVYTFLDDAVGAAVADALIERAAAGLDVRLIYDAVGSQTTPAVFFGAMIVAGVKVHAYHSLWDAIWRLSLLNALNRRNHRKLLVIDGSVAYFGGMNIIENAAPRSTVSAARAGGGWGWRDLHVRLVGPQVADVAESFERSWRQAHHLPVERRSRAYRRGAVGAPNGECIRLFDSGPGPKYTRAARVFARLMRRSRLSILLSMAYFLPGRLVYRAMLKARRRGSRVAVVVPAESDVKLVERATRHLYSRLLRHGIEVHERQERMLHSKVMVVDGQWTVVGSSNLDPRSLEMNLEFLAVIRSAAFAAAATAICDEEIRHSHRLNSESLARRSRWQRLLDRGAYWLRPWL